MRRPALCIILLVLSGNNTATISTAIGLEPTPPALQPVQEQATVWPEGSVVKGRVVDQEGVAVPNAEVLLLGEERIFVDADKLNWFVASTDKGRPPNPPSTRTDGNGEFSIERKNGTANRLAVISKDLLLWVVSRKNLQQADNIELALPQAGSLAIHCDLPGKSATQPVMIELRTFDDVDWNRDVLRFHFSSFSVTNPGETVFEHLPPGRYSVQRNQETRTGEHEMLITLADRQLAKVESNRRSTVTIERKVGRPLTGQVRGLENVDLDNAHVTINYFGPEEEPGRNGKRAKHGTAFDVIAITSDGRFTTDPIPPGDYWLDLFAVRSSTPQQSPRQSDFKGTVRFAVPETGDMPKVEVIAKPRGRQR